MFETSSNEDKFKDDDGSVQQARKKPRTNQSMACAPGFNPGSQEDESEDEDSGHFNDVAKSNLGGLKQSGEFGITLSLIIHRHFPNSHTYP